MGVRQHAESLFALVLPGRIIVLRARTAVAWPQQYLRDCRQSGCIGLAALIPESGIDAYLCQKLPVAVRGGMYVAAAVAFVTHEQGLVLFVGSGQ